MSKELTKEEISLIKEAFKWSLYNIENYTKYPSPEYKEKRLNELRNNYNDIIIKLDKVKIK